MWHGWYLDGGRGEHGLDRQADALHTQRWRPIVAQNVETNVTVCVDVGMHGGREHEGYCGEMVQESMKMTEKYLAEE